MTSHEINTRGCFLAKWKNVEGVDREVLRKPNQPSTEYIASIRVCLYPRIYTPRIFSSVQEILTHHVLRKTILELVKKGHIHYTDIEKKDSWNMPTVRNIKHS
jgi:hypothetical protein